MCTKSQTEEVKRKHLTRAYLCGTHFRIEVVFTFRDKVRATSSENKSKGCS